MIKYRIGDIAKIISERVDNPANCEYKKFVGLEHYVSGEIEINKYGDTSLLKSAMKIFKSGDILIARRNVYLKRSSIVSFDGITSGDSIVLRIEDDLIRRILPFVLNTDEFWDYAEKFSDGTMSKRLSPKVLLEYEFSLPEVEKQEKLAELLWAANNTKEAYENLLYHTAELVKSQFIEMFGSPIDNSKGWSVLPLKILTSKLGSGATPKGGNASYKDEGISLIRSMNVYNGYFDYDKLAYIDEDQAKKLDNVTINEADVLLNITGASVARCCIVPFEILPARVNQHVCIIRCNQDKVLPLFLNNMIIGNEYQAFLWNLAESAGATRQALTKEQIENLNIIVPPIELQQEYVSFIEQTNKSKIALQQNISNLEKTIKALMSKNFG